MLAPGQTVKDLTIVRALGSRALVDTYEVQCPDGASAVLKVFAPEAFTESTAAGLAANFAKLARLKPARIAAPRALAVWLVHDTDRLCMLRDLAPGRSLADILADRPTWSAEEASSFACHVLEALAGLHKEGLACQGLKPGNIIGTDGAETLADVGLGLIDASDLELI
jgi:hypothetical protein